MVNAEIVSAAKNYNIPALRKNDLNIPDDISSTAIIKTEVELRNKNQPAKKRAKNKADLNVVNIKNVDVPMEKVQCCLFKVL